VLEVLAGLLVLAERLKHGAQVVVGLGADPVILRQLRHALQRQLQP
jgi:hypothetical protein